MSDKPEIRGLLFDKDGTLFDFAASWSGVLIDTLTALTSDVGLRHQMAMAVGFDLSSNRFRPGSPCVAGAMDEVAEIWARYVPDRTVRDVEALANSIAANAVADGGLCPAVPDLSQFLADLCTAGLVLGIATHDSEAAARSHMAQFGALDHFAFIAGYDSGHGLKPGPGMLLAFAERTGLAPSQIAMVGDSIHDLGVVPAAGAAMAVGVLTGPADAAELEPLADHVLDSIAGLPDLLGLRL